MDALPPREPGELSKMFTESLDNPREVCLVVLPLKSGSADITAAPPETYIHRVLFGSVGGAGVLYFAALFVVLGGSV